MPQLQQVTAEEEESAYRSPTPAAATQPGWVPDVAPAARAEASRAEETRRDEMNRPGRAAFGDPLAGELPASARYVRPDELLAALTAIENRKGESVVGSMPIGETLAKIGAEVTPEEVWQEVYSQRSSQNKSRKLSDYEAQRRRKRWIGGGIALACVFSTAIALRVLAGDVKAIVGASPEANSKTILPPVPPAPQAQVIDSPGVQYRSQDMIPLSQLPDGKPFRASMSEVQELTRLLHGDSFHLPASPEQLARTYVKVDGGTNGNDDWETATWHNRAYLRGWISAPPGTRVADLLASGKITIYNSPNHPELPPGTGRQLQIPGDAFNSYSGHGANGFEKAEIGGLQRLDPNAWEPWEPLPPKNPLGAPGSGSSSVYVGGGQSVPVQMRATPYRPAIRVRDVRVPNPAAGASHFYAGR